MVPIDGSDCDGVAKGILVLREDHTFVRDMTRTRACMLVVERDRQPDTQSKRRS